MPKPIPLGSRPIQERRRSMIYRPYEPQTIHDPTKSFRDSKLIYLSDLKIYRECKISQMNNYYGK